MADNITKLMKGINLHTPKVQEPLDTLKQIKVHTRHTKDTHIEIKDKKTLENHPRENESQLTFCRKSRNQETLEHVSLPCWKEVSLDV